jgi:hypothetical protein
LQTVERMNSGGNPWGDMERPRGLYKGEISLFSVCVSSLTSKAVKSYNLVMRNGLVCVAVRRQRGKLW